MSHLLKTISAIPPTNTTWGQAVNIHWQIAAQMFDRKVNGANLKISIPSKTRKALEPWIDALAAEWELCVMCFAIAAGELPYQNALEWFSEILNEAKLHDLREPTGKGKREHWEDEDGERWVAEALRKGCNPYQPNNSALLHNHRLIQTALDICDRNAGFKNRYWLPYVQSYCRWIRHKRNSPLLAAALEVKGDRIYYSAGKGRGKKSVKILSAETHAQQEFQGLLHSTPKPLETSF